MAEFDYDFFVIGAGSGGVRASRFAAGHGVRVGLAEDTYLGGTCVNVGCVPKKLFVYAAHYAHDFEDAAGFGWRSEHHFDWAKLRDNKNREIRRLNSIYAKLLEMSNVDLIEGHARLDGPHRVVVGERTVTARHILLAVGGEPFVPDFPGRELVLTSNDIFYLPRLPRTMLIVGGGYIAVEFAGILSGLGVAVTQYYRRDLFLRGFDLDLREKLAEEMAKSAVDLQFNTDVERIERLADDRLRVYNNRGDTLDVDAVLYATGRKPRLQGLGLDSVDVAVSGDGYIEVDDKFETGEPGIYALGDATGGLELTPVALAEGMALADRLFGGDSKRTVNYEYVPSAVFSQPNMASVGYTEEAARERFGDIAVYTTAFTHLKHTLSGRDEKTFMKLIVDSASDRVVGAHMLGDEAGEIIQGIAVAMQAGATKAHFDATIGIHPTAAEEFVTLRTRTR